MRKIMLTAAVLGSAMALAPSPGSALQIVVTSIHRNADGTSTWHFGVQTDPGENLTPGEDFVTIYNFAGLVAGSAKSPPGWIFSSEDFGKTPTWNGYPAVLPVDVPGLSNLTWTAKRPIAAGTTIDGFAATTGSARTTEGEYAAQITRSSGGKSGKQAIIGQLATPAFLGQ